MSYNELTEIQIEEIKTKAEEARDSKGKLPRGFKVNTGKKYGTSGQYIGQILSGKKRVNGPKNNSKPGKPKGETKEITSDSKDTKSVYTYIPRVKFRLPNFAELKVFLQDHESDPVCKKLYYRMFVNNRDAGTYRDFYYIIEEMNKNK